MKRVALLLSLLCVACPKPTQSYFLGPTAPSQEATTPRSYIYIVRSTERFIGDDDFPIIINDGVVGVIGTRESGVYEVPPGPISLHARAEAYSQILFDAAPGRAYYFALQPQMGWRAARAQLTPITPEQGKQMLSALQKL